MQEKGFHLSAECALFQPYAPVNYILSQLRATLALVSATYLACSQPHVPTGSV